ncbi:glutamate dehydrogenase, partial [Phytohabitans kaempferiae]
MPRLDEKLHAIYDQVLRRNPGEVEFHQAVHEVLDSLGPVVAKHPEYAEYADGAVISRLCEPERQI